MTRFREEVYAKRSYKAEVARRRRRTESPDEAYARARRAEYLKNTPAARAAIRKAQAARLDGF